MALKLSHELSSGVTGNYWRVVDYKADIATSVGEIYLALYMDKAARDAGKNPLYIDLLNFTGADFPFTLDKLNPLNENPVKVSYAKVKTLTSPIDFTKAIDV